MEVNAVTYDVVIIGGGCAGASTALCLLQQGINNIAIIEKSDFSAPRIGETIQPPTAGLLKQLGAWESFLQDAHLPSLGVSSAWGTSDLDFTDFIFKAQGNGWHLDRNRFDKMMLRLALQNGARLFSQLQLTGALWNNGAWLLECGATTLKAKFAVDATGRARAFAKLQASNKIHFDDLHGIYTYWEKKQSAESSASSHTLVESVENGWWYSALLPDKRLAVAFMTDKAGIKDKGLKEADNYLQNLAYAPQTSRRISQYEMIGLPAVKAAGAYLSDLVAGDNWLAVGDSASAFDPLSSYGIHKALQGGINAGACIKAVLNGNRAAINDYEHAVKMEFENFLETRFAYYQMETRWSGHPFWKCRQKLTGIHPLQELTTNQDSSTYQQVRNRILPEEDMNTLVRICTHPQKAFELVKHFQESTHRKYPDWLIIHAVSYLHEMKVIV
jgi:flavin-dependent dehydrogenase